MRAPGGELAMDTGTPSSMERYLAMATAAASSPPSTPPLTILVIKFSPTLLHLHNLPISQFLRAR